MLKTDGSWVFYIIQHKDNEGKWTRSNFDHFGHPGDWRSKDSFSACGDCWQQTGESATFVERVAKDAVKEFTKKHPKYKWRYMKVSIIQSTTKP